MSRPRGTDALCMSCYTNAASWRLVWVDATGRAQAAYACARHLNRVAARHVEDAGPDPSLSLTPIGDAR